MVDTGHQIVQIVLLENFDGLVAQRIAPEGAYRIGFVAELTGKEGKIGGSTS